MLQLRPLEHSKVQQAYISLFQIYHNSPHWSCMMGKPSTGLITRVANFLSSGLELPGQKKDPAPLGPRRKKIPALMEVGQDEVSVKVELMTTKD